MSAGTLPPRQGPGCAPGVKTTGCSGLAYKLEYVDESEPEDVVFENHGVKVLIDPKSLAYIDGTELILCVKASTKGFKFNNPNERDRCGCGELPRLTHRPSGLVVPMKPPAHCVLAVFS